jgi:hypothetical protein
MVLARGLHLGQPHHPAQQVAQPIARRRHAGNRQLQPVLLVLEALLARQLGERRRQPQQQHLGVRNRVVGIEQ